MKGGRNWNIIFRNTSSQKFWRTQKSGCDGKVTELGGLFLYHERKMQSPHFSCGSFTLSLPGIILLLKMSFLWWGRPYSTHGEIALHGDCCRFWPVITVQFNFFTSSAFQSNCVKFPHKYKLIYYVIGLFWTGAASANVFFWHVFVFVHGNDW